MPSLPLKAQVAIRDHWTNPSSPLQQALQNLSTLLGHDVVAEPEWPQLIAELDPVYADDRGQLVTAVAGCVQVWARAMAELLDDSTNEAWAEMMLEKVPVRMRIFVEVPGSERAVTAWSEERGGFVVGLPKRQVVQLGELLPTFRGGLLACFGGEKKAPEPVAAGDDWVEAEAVENPVSRSAQALPVRAKVEYLPSVESLPRPDQLFLRPPYHLTVIDGHQSVEVHCSHSPSLQVLAGYLKRWCRVNHADTRNPPAIEVTLHQSAFGLGEMFDKLTLTSRFTNRFHVTSPMVVSLVEGVLGYTLVSTNGSWNFRRDTEFKTL